MAKEKKAVCIRCGCDIAFPCSRIAAEETINSMRDGEGPGLVSSLGWTCGGSGGDEGKVKEVKEKKASPEQMESDFSADSFHRMR